MYNINNLDYNYTYNKIISIMDDAIGLYLYIKKDNKNRAKLTIKTILMSLQKQDLLTFSRYYEIFKDTLFKIKSDHILNDEEINNREIAFNLLTQVKILVDSNINTENNIIERGFFNLDNQNFYLFKIKDSNNFLTNSSEIINKQELKLYYHNIIYSCAEELLNKYFDFNNNTNY